MPPLYGLALLPALAGGFDVHLGVDRALVPIGTGASFTLEAPPGAYFALEASVLPAEVDLGALGTLYLAPLARIPLAAGLVPGSGSALHVLDLPSDPALVGAVLYVQGGAFSGGLVRLSNSVAIRAESEAPSAPRAPLAVAVTPDGLRAYVAHRDDGLLSVIDATTDSLLAEVPAGPSARGLLTGPVHLAVEPDGAHLWSLNAADAAITLLDAASASVTHKLPSARGNKRVAFDFDASPRRIYVSNDALDQVLVYEQPAAGVYVPQAALTIDGSDPGALVVLPDGRLLIACRGSHSLELVDPSVPGGLTQNVRALERAPYDLSLDGNVARVATFTFGAGIGDGQNQVLRYTIPSLLLLGSELLDAGTDYLDITAAGSFLALTGAGSGSLVLAERASGALLDVVDLAPFQPLATPQEAAFVRATGANEPHKLYVVNYFRESLRAIDLTAGAPYALGAEVALAHSGQIRLPFVDLSPEEDGDWFLRSVQFFKGTPSSPNPVTCFTCHTDNGSDGLQHLKNPPVLWRAGDTGPWGSKGNKPVLSAVVSSTFGAHGIFAGPPTPVSISTIVAFLENDAPAPPSPFVGLDGSLGADALAGKALFEGSAGCVQCHAAPLYIPPPGNPLTIAGGVGTGLLNANVPTLLGVWASAPYLHSGDATTLEDVLTMNAGDLHGTTSQLTAAERAQLVAFLRTL